MRSLLSTSRHLSRAALLVVPGFLAAGPAAGQQTFEACYVPAIGALYLINQTGLPTACLSNDHVAISWTEGGELADGSVTAVKLADGAVTTIKLADAAVTEAKLGLDVATQAELDTHAGSADHDGRYFTEAELSDAGTLNAGTNPVDWTRLKGVPADFADGVDDGGGVATDIDCTGCVGTADLADAAVTEAKLGLDVATQTELDTHAGSADHDGRYFTEAELSDAGTLNAGTNPVDWTRLKNVPAAFADGTDDNTVYTAGTGLTLTAGTFAADLAGPGAATTVARSDHTHALPGQNNTGVGDGALVSTTTGTGNTAVGSNALGSTTTGYSNTALGLQALRDNEGGLENVAIGAGALRLNVTGNANAAVGVSAMANGGSGQGNVAVGSLALLNGNGDLNVAVGRSAGFSATSGQSNVWVGYLAGSDVTSGSNNIAVGREAGSSVTVGSYNIHIGNPGTAADDSIIRIGNGQDSTYIAGIFGAAISGTTVLVNSTGRLGVSSSSIRFKEAVEDMGTASHRLFDLRPVRFRYRPEYGGSGAIQYGLIAEEVEEVFPELVVYDQDGRVQTVRYHLLSVLLLNEVQRQEAQLRRQEAELTELVELRRQVEALRASVEALQEAARPDGGKDER